MKKIIWVIIFILILKIAVVIIFNAMDFKDSEDRDLIAFPKGINTLGIDVEE